VAAPGPRAVREMSLNYKTPEGHSKLEAGFKAELRQGKIRQAFKSKELEEYRQAFFSKNGERGAMTIDNFQLLRAKLGKSFHTGTINGKMHSDVSQAAGPGVDEFDDERAPRDPMTSSGKMKKVTPITLNRVFQNAETLKLFYAFASLRHVPEGILFWSEVESLQNINWKANKVLGIYSAKLSEDDIAERVRQIWIEYLSSDASYEVCLPGHMLKEIEHGVRSGRPARTIFTAAQTLVFRDMEKGLFREFLSTLNSDGLRFVNRCFESTHSPGLAAATALSFVQRKTDRQRDAVSDSST
jgi:hypothetical protein